MKGLRFEKKSMNHVWMPLVWLMGFTPKRRRAATHLETIPQSEPMKGLDLTVMSFNIRRGTAKDGRNHWTFRRHRVQEMLHRHRPDVLGLQEAMDFQISAVRSMLPGYAIIGLGNLGGSEGMHNAIFYDTARFTLSEEGTFWLSDTPDIPGSKSWGSVYHRTCSWARLIDRASRQAFYFYNTHLDHVSLRARKKGVVLLTQRIHCRTYSDPFVLTGDFNAREKSAPIQFLKGTIHLGTRATGPVLNPNPLRDTFRVRHPNHRRPGTFHGYQKFFFRFKIDYIFVPPSVLVHDAQIIIPRWKERYPSDHFPLITTISLPMHCAPQPEGSLFSEAGQISLCA